MQPENGLAGPRSAPDHVGALRNQPAAQNFVQARNPYRDPGRCVVFLLAHCPFSRYQPAYEASQLECSEPNRITRVSTADPLQRLVTTGADENRWIKNGQLRLECS